MGGSAIGGGVVSQKLIPSMTGYKATDAKMRCRGHQFELGKWYEVDGELELCHNGFHFCDHWSGVWAYYDSPSTRIFKIEAEDVLDLPIEPGAAHKRVCRRIRLVKEARPTDDYGNSGDGNSGYGNCMDRSPDVFCMKPRNVRCFDGPTNLSYEELTDKYLEIYDLVGLLIQHEPIEFERFKNIPNITPKKLQALHNAHLKARGIK